MPHSCNLILSSEVIRPTLLLNPVPTWGFSEDPANLAFADCHAILVFMLVSMSICNEIISPVTKPCLLVHSFEVWIWWEQKPQTPYQRPENVVNFEIL